jgi:anti-sigma regulatory factor (Ser/Thr protein kinase)
MTGAHLVLHVGTSQDSASSAGSTPQKAQGSQRPHIVHGIGGSWARTFRGTPASVPEARRFAGELLAGCPAREVLLMCVSELCTNAIAHSASGNGGVFIVEVNCPRDGVARVAVTDEGGPSVPAPRALDLMAEGGRGLALVAACTSRWGHADAHPGRTVWAEASWPVPVPSPGQATAARRPRSRERPPRDVPPGPAA